jgi:hypothetical protein
MTRRNFRYTGSVDFKAKSPLAGNACLTPDVRLDSGLLNSNDDLGMNSLTKHSFSFCRITTCAPVNAEKYVTPRHDNLTEVYGGKTKTRVEFYEFGRDDPGCLATRAAESTNLTTFCVSDWMRDYLTGAYTII